MQIGSFEITKRSQFIETATCAAEWIAKNGKIAGKTLLVESKKVAIFAKDFFAFAAVQFMKSFQFIKTCTIQGIRTAREHIQSNPKVYAAAGIGIGIGIAISAIYNRISGRTI